METHKLKSKDRKSKFLVKGSRKELVLGTVIATIIAISPYLFDLYQIVPNTKVWDNFLFTYNSNYYESTQITAWTLMNKLIPLLLLFIWFFTCRHWWYHALLVPIAMYFFHIGVILTDDLQYVDTFQIIYLIPIMAVVIPSIYLIRARIVNKLNSVDDSMQELEDEFKIKPKGLWGKVKQYF